MFILFEFISFICLIRQRKSSCLFITNIINPMTENQHKVQLKLLFSKLEIQNEEVSLASITIQHNSKRISTNWCKLGKERPCSLNKQLELEYELKCDEQTIKKAQIEVQISIFLFKDKEENQYAKGVVKTMIFQGIGYQTIEMSPDEFGKVVIHFIAQFQILDFLKQESKVKKRSIMQIRQQNQSIKRQVFPQNPESSPTLNLNRTKKWQEIQYMSKKIKKPSIQIDNYLKKPGTMRKRQYSQSIQKTKLYDDLKRLNQKLETDGISKHSREKYKLKKYSKDKVGNIEFEDPYLKNEKKKLNRIKSQNVEKEEQIYGLKEKLRLVERKEKNYQLQVRELMEEIHKKQEKINTSDQIQQNLQRQLTQKNMMIRGLQTTKINLENNIQELSSKQNTNAFKISLKETSFRQRIRKFEDKIQFLENERVIILKDSNEYLDKVQNAERKYQNMLKERDQKYLQEKTQNLKQIRQISDKNTILQREVQAQLVKITSLQQNLEKSEDKIKLFEKKKQDMQVEIEQMRFSFKKEKELIVSQQLDSQKNYSEQSNSLRKKNNQLNSELLVFKQKIGKLMKEITDNETKIKQGEQILKNKGTQMNKLINKFSKHKRKYEEMEQDGLKKVKQIQRVQVLFENANQKINDYKQKLNAEKWKKEEISNDLEKRLVCENKKRQFLQNEIKDMKWKVTRNEDTIYDLQCRLRQTNNQKMQVTQDLFTIKQKLQKLQQRTQISDKQFELTCRQKNQLDFSLRELSETIRNKVHDYELEVGSKQNRIKNFEDEVKRLNQILILFRKDRNRLEEQKDFEKQELNLKRIQEIRDLSLLTSKQSQQIMSLKKSYQVAYRETEMLKMDGEGSRNQISLLQSYLTSTKEKTIEIENEKDTLMKQLSNSKQEVESLKQKCVKLQNQHSSYKLMMIKCVGELCDIVLKEQNRQSCVRLIKFEETEIKQIVLQMLQKRAKIIAGVSEKLKQKQLQVQNLEREIEKQRKESEQNDKQTSQTHAQQITNLKTSIADYFTEKTMISQKIFHLQDKESNSIGQINHLRNELTMKEDIINECNGQLTLLISEFEGLKEENQEVNKALVQRKKQFIKIQASNSERIDKMEEMARSDKEKLEIEIENKNRRITDLQRIETDKQEKIAKLEGQIKEKSIELERVKGDLENSQQKVCNLQLQTTKLNNLIKNHEKIIHEQKQQIQSKEDKSSQIQLKCQKLKTTMNQLKQENTQMSLKLARVTSEKQNASEMYEEVRGALRQKGQSNQSKIVKLMQQVSELKEQLIQKDSALSFKEFSLFQNEQKNKDFTQQQIESKESCTKLKAKNIDLLNNIYELEKKLRDSDSFIDRVSYELEKKQSLLSKNNFAFFEYENEINELKNNQKLHIQKEKQLIETIESQQNQQQLYRKQKKRLNEENQSLKKQSIMMKEEEQRLIKYCRKGLEESQNGFHSKIEQLENNFQLEKRQLLGMVRQAEEDCKEVIDQLENKLEKIKEESEFLKYQNIERLQTLQTQQNKLDKIKKQFERLEQKYDDEKQKCKKYNRLYNEMNIQLEKHLNEINKKKDKEIEELKKNVSISYTKKMKEILSKMEEMKNKQLQRNEGIYLQPQYKKTVKHFTNDIRNSLEEFIAKEKENTFKI